MWIKTNKGLINLNHIQRVSPPREEKGLVNKKSFIIDFPDNLFELRYDTQKQADKMYKYITSTVLNTPKYYTCVKCGSQEWIPSGGEDG